DVPESLFEFSALAPVWANPQWDIQLASAGGIVSDAGDGLYLGDMGTHFYSLADGQLKGRHGDDGSGVLLGSNGLDTISFDAGAEWAWTGTELTVINDNQTTTRSWFTSAAYQTDTFVGSGFDLFESSYLSLGALNYNLFDFAERMHAEFHLGG